MPKFKDLDIEFEGKGKELKIKKAMKHVGGEDVTNKFKTADLEAFNSEGGPPTCDYGTVIVAKCNPYCYWVRCGDGWYVYCW